MSDMRAILLIEADPLRALAIERALGRAGDLPLVIPCPTIADATLLLRGGCDREIALVLLADARPVPNPARELDALCETLGSRIPPIVALSGDSTGTSLCRCPGVAEACVLASDVVELAGGIAAQVRGWLRTRTAAAAA